MYSATDLLLLGAAVLPAGLVPAERALSAAAACQGGPAIWAWAVAECRLGGSDDSVDFAVCTSGPGGKAAWRACGQRLPPTWGDTLPRLLDAWATPADPMASAAYVWAELDGWSAGDSDLRPLLYPAVEGLAPGVVRALARRAAAIDDRVPAAALDAWQAAIDRLPEGARPMQLGLLPSRGVPGLRLFAAVPTPALADWLAAIGWAGDSPAFCAFAASLARYSSHVELQVDFTPTAAGPIATEVLFPSTPAEDPRWRVLLDGLADAGLVDPRRAEVLIRWARGAGLDARVPRGVQVKVGWRDGHPGTAKGYLTWAVPS